MQSTGLSHSPRFTRALAALHGVAHDLGPLAHPCGASRPIRRETHWATPAWAPGLHEWFTADATPAVWVPPLTVLAWLARGRAPSADAPDNHPAISQGLTRSQGLVLWIGRACWPHPQALVWPMQAAPAAAGEVDRGLLDRSVFVEAGLLQAGVVAAGDRTPTDTRRARPRRRAAPSDLVWAVEQAVRCPGVAAVVADGRGLSMTDSRRLQLAAAAGGVPAWLARPPWELGELSAARTRWRVSPRAPEDARGRADGGGAGVDIAWTVELLRCKGVQPDAWGARRWAVRRGHATRALHEWTAGDVGVAADVADRVAAAS